MPIPRPMQLRALGINVDEVRIWVLTSSWSIHAHARETIIQTSSPNVDLIPAHIDLVAIEIELVDKDEREYMLKKGHCRA